MNNNVYQLLLSLKLGDGSYVTQNVTQNKNYRVMTNSINEDYIAFKRNVLEENDFTTKTIKCQSGYNKNSNIVGFTSHITPETTLVGRMSIVDAINDLDLIGLILLYLDDGSLHKRKHFMHIYCNSFTEEETMLLINKIHEFFPSKICALRHDVKKDGRSFPYIYIPVIVAKEFNVEVRKFLMDNNVDSLLYKTFLPSQTIESIDN